MLLNCDNKGCMQTTEAKLDVKTGEVICAECNRPIKNVSESMKRTLKSFGQIIRDDVKKAFMMGCKNCQANREVVLNDKNETVCSVCKEKINVHMAMKQAIMELGNRLKEEPKTDSKSKIKRKKE